MNRKRIICFGDSNTWGYNPATDSRYDEDSRWTMILQEKLGSKYLVLEEGQNGRTIACPDPWEWGTKSGLDYILPMVESHNPFDLLIIMLGTNDLKIKFGLPAGDIAGSLQNMLIRTISYLQYQCKMPEPKILIASPPWLGEEVTEGIFSEFFNEDGMKKSRKLAYWYQLVAQQFGCEFLDTSETVTGLSPLDHLHLSPEGHRQMAETMEKKVRQILEEQTAQ